MKYKFVNEEIQVFVGNQAKTLLEQHNDSKYFTNDGIIQIDKSRWEEAQRYESKTWMVACAGNNDDHNVKNAEMFNNYSILTEESPISAIEMGCGPFTNMRLVLDKCPTIKEVFLSDPLIESYLNHNGCTYKNNKLNNRDIHIIVSPLEELTTERTYDLIILINVLEHCYDIPKILANIERCMHKDSIFVFGDLIIDIDTIKRMSLETYDSGHPIRISKQYIDKFLTKFTELFRKENNVILNQDLDQPHLATMFYYIGKYNG